MRYRFLRFPGGKFKAVTFSYDDGVKSDIRLAEIFNKNGLKGTFNINTDKYLRENTDTVLTIEETKTHILDAGHEVAIHGDHHIAPGVSRPVDAVRDVLDCREKLEDIFDIIIRGMAYPDSGVRRFHNGNNYENVKRMLEDLGVVYSRTLGGDNNSFTLPSDWHSWMPTMHHNNPEAFNYIEKFISDDESRARTASRYPRLFYVWGHSYEFDNNNNWDRIEQICEKLAGRDDTWYATNIEIYEYCHAYNSLIWSSSGKTVYNPTLRTVWFDIDSKLYSVASGETLKFPK